MERSELPANCRQGMCRMMQSCVWAPGRLPVGRHLYRRRDAGYGLGPSQISLSSSTPVQRELSPPSCRILPLPACSELFPLLGRATPIPHLFPDITAHILCRLARECWLFLGLVCECYSIFFPASRKHERSCHTTDLRAPPRVRGHLGRPHRR